MNRILILICFALLFDSTYQSNACTTFLISGKYTLDGKPILFKNRDTDQMQNALVYFTDGKFRYIALVDGNNEWDKMVWGGYNETGFAIINSAAYNNNVGDTSKFMDQEGVIMKLALQTCRTLDDFEKLLNSLPKPMGLDANFGVIDAFGGAAFYETGNYGFKKFDANDPKLAPNGLLVRTNHSTSADLTKGFGFCRYNTAIAALEKALQSKKLSPQVLFNIVSRNLYHSLTKNDLSKNLPKQRDIPEYEFFIDYIPRESTASAILIHGAKDAQHTDQAMMWTILGFPLTSVAVPVWISAGEKLPKTVSLNLNLKAPICEAALKFKEDCFPLKYDKGWNYINFSAVMNQQKTGYMQLLKPIENEIFKNADRLIIDLDNGSKSRTDIVEFYSWIDNYLNSKYKEQFKIELLHD